MNKKLLPIEDVARKLEIPEKYYERVGPYGAKVRLVLLGVPAEAVAGPVALYLADVAWTLQRRIRGGERWLQAHRTHVYQRWCDAGWSHQEVTLLTSALSVLLCLLGAAGLLGGTADRVLAGLAELGVLAVYLASPGLFARLGEA